MHGDFDEHNIGAYDFLYVNPDKPFHRNLDQKLEEQMNEKAMLMVYGLEYLPNKLNKINSFNLNGTHVGLFMK